MGKNGFAQARRGVMVEYVGEEEKAVVPTPMAMGRGQLVFAAQDVYEGRKVVIFPDEEVARRFMHKYNRGKPPDQILFQIAYDLLEAELVELVDRRVDKRVLELLDQAQMGDLAAAVRDKIKARKTRYDMRLLHTFDQVDEAAAQRAAEQQEAEEAAEKDKKKRGRRNKNDPPEPPRESPELGTEVPAGETA